jgi:hypothetical protein
MIEAGRDEESRGAVAQDGVAPNIVADMRVEAAHLRSLLALFLCIDQVRTHFTLDVEEALLYLGIGYLNTERMQKIGGIGYIAATNISSVADFVHLSKETARRKIKRMISMGLLEAEAGLVVRDIERWFAFVEMLPKAERKTIL